MSGSEKTLEKSSLKFWALDLIFFLALLGADYATKKLAIANLSGGDVNLISGVLSFHLLENAGMAFSLFQGKTLLFYIFTPLLIFLILFVFARLPKTGRFTPLRVSLTVLLAGAFGNFIDRILKKTVTDFIYFSLIDFPVFNVADIYVVLSMAAIILLLMFYYKDEELEFLN